ncbi:hypothetical protein F4780DRAFT_650716 [Xylariomycetidae sp. FL0641]|nr:hypothetical protein F4780DRAFT_650716 [Xylariomycetidae sp. FL0641]
MSGPRLTAPASKLLARSISTTTTTSAVASSTTIATSSRAAAPLSRKYADLLRERNLDGDHPRRITTRTNRPYPQPKKLRLMQTFSSGAPVAAAAEAATMDRMVFPGSASAAAAVDPYTPLRVPLLPDNFGAVHAVAEQPVAADDDAMPEISVVAADPASVAPAALTEIEGMGVDGVELKFVYDGAEAEPEPQQYPSMLTGLWQNLEGVFGAGRNKQGSLAV